MYSTHSPAPFAFLSFASPREANSTGTLCGEMSLALMNSISESVWQNAFHHFAGNGDHLYVPAHVRRSGSLDWRHTPGCCSACLCRGCLGRSFDRVDDFLTHRVSDGVIVQRTPIPFFAAWETWTKLVGLCPWKCGRVLSPTRHSLETQFSGVDSQFEV